MEIARVCAPHACSLLKYKGREGLDMRHVVGCHDDEIFIVHISYVEMRMRSWKVNKSGI